MSTTPRKLRIALARAAVAGHIIDLGRGVKVTVEPVPETNPFVDVSEELVDLAAVGAKDSRDHHGTRKGFLEAPAASTRIQ
jgi:hypothetical protein